MFLLLLLLLLVFFFFLWEAEGRGGWEEGTEEISR